MGDGDAIRDGAEAFKELLSLVQHVAEESSLDASEAGDVEGDCADYRLMFALVARSLIDNVARASEDHREGYLRALTDLLVAVAGGGVPTERWDPIANTELAFSASKAANAAIAGASNEG